MEFNWRLFLWTGLNFILLILFIVVCVRLVIKFRAMMKDIKEIKERINK